MKVIYTNDYEMECPYFQYIGKNPAIKSDSGFFYCTYTGTNPICNNCPFAQEKAVKHKLNQESS